MSPKPRRKPETDPRQLSAPRARRQRAEAPAIAWNATAPLTPTGARAWTLIAWIALGALAAVLIAMALGPHRVGDYFTESDFYGAYADGWLIQRGRLVPSRYGVIGPATRWRWRWPASSCATCCSPPSCSRS